MGGPERKAAFIYSLKLQEYTYPEECPFNTGRAGKVRDTLRSMGILTNGDLAREFEPDAADRESLEKIHSPRYLDALMNAANGKYGFESLRMGIGGPDCPVFPDMYRYPAMACGASLKGVELLLEGEVDLAFNPSGGFHHAGPELASGFCYMNDVALACHVLAENGKRVLYLDVDVHHADGVQEIFYGRDDVMTISLHESGRTLFPGTGFTDEIGRGRGEGYSVNIPFIPGTYDDVYLYAFIETVLPLIRAYNPDVIVFELGADALAGDPLAHLQLTNNSFVDIIEDLLSFNKPMLMTGGGGYNVKNTVRAWSLAWSVLSGTDSFLQDLNIGLGGVFMESTDWHGGLRDREVPVGDREKSVIIPAVQDVVDEVKEKIFPYHGI
ncbi:MAG: acetoin utilization protein AcuC [Acidobacteriota bacterium]